MEYIRRKAFGFKSDFADTKEAEKHLESIITRINQTKQQLTGRTAMEMFADEKKLLWQYTGSRAGRKSTIVTTNLGFDRWKEIFVVYFWIELLAYFSTEISNNFHPIHPHHLHTGVRVAFGLRFVVHTHPTGYA